MSVCLFTCVIAPCHHILGGVAATLQRFICVVFDVVYGISTYTHTEQPASQQRWQQQIKRMGCKICGEALGNNGNPNPIEAEKRKTPKFDVTQRKKVYFSYDKVAVAEAVGP